MNVESMPALNNRAGEQRPVSPTKGNDAGCYAGQLQRALQRALHDSSYMYLMYLIGASGTNIGPLLR